MNKKLIALLVANLFAAAPALAADDFRLQGSVSVGGIGVDESAPDASKMNEYRDLSLERRSVLMKVHGTVSRDDESGDSYVITEDHYIEYLAQTDIANIIPAALMAVMNESHFLFLGYSLRDWNLRVILQRIWGRRPFEEQYKSWAIRKDPSRLEERLWASRNVEIMNLDLDAYVAALRGALDGVVAGPAAA